MLSVSENAVKELNEFFSDKEKSPIRIYLAPGGCSGPRLALALDAPGDADQTFDEAGYNFCVEKDLLTQTGDISIDVNYMGFAVESANSMGGGGCCGCASSGSCGSAEA